MSSQQYHDLIHHLGIYQKQQQSTALAHHDPGMTLTNVCYQVKNWHHFAEAKQDNRISITFTSHFSTAMQIKEISVTVRRWHSIMGEVSTLSMLVLVGVEFIFFRVAGMGQHFGFMLNTVLMI